jgi:Phytanoyl-CoA dioxygenase (PhyH)
MTTRSPLVGALAEVALEAADHERGRADPAKVAAAVRAIAEDGAVILLGALDPVPLRQLSQRMDEDLGELLRRPDRAENFAPGHLQQDPPAESALLWPDVLAHPFVLSVCRQVLRQPLRLTSYTNNTNLAGSHDQDVHVDEGQLWPGLDRAHPAARLTVNIPLSPADAESGAIELWPGTHLDPRLSRFAATPQDSVALALSYMRAAKRAEVAGVPNRRVGLTVPESLLRERRARQPPLRAETRLGDLIIRDPRVWHRGTANHAAKCRFMLALTYDPEWRLCAEPMELPLEARDLFAAAGLAACAVYRKGPIDHLDRHRPPRDSPLKRVAADRRTPGST